MAAAGDSHDTIPAITGPEAETPWTPFRVVVAVAWGPNQAISAETIRLGRKAGGP